MPNQNTTQRIKIAFIGGGNMAKALIGGLYRNQAADVHVIDINADQLSKLNERFGVSTSQQIDSQITECDVVVLAVKPQQMHEVADKLTPFLSKQLVVSIAAGIRVLDLSKWLHNYSAIVRTMPNMPALINSGITGMYATSTVTPEQRAIADAMLTTVGKTIWLDNEALMDSLTAISGSGPAYVFYFIEVMQKAAQEMGLSHQQGRELALATFLGASQLAAQSDEDVTALRARVTSKGGTTFAAINSMEQSEVGSAIITAVKVASERARELGNQFSRS